jgi:hypothetical protein
MSLNIFLQGGGHGFLFRPVAARLPRFLDQFVVNRKVCSHV